MYVGALHVYVGGGVCMCVWGHLHMYVGGWHVYVGGLYVCMWEVCMCVCERSACVFMGGLSGVLLVYVGGLHVYVCECGFCPLMYVCVYVQAVQQQMRAI